MASDFENLGENGQPPERDTIELRADTIDEPREVRRLVQALNRAGQNQRAFQYAGRAAVIIKDRSTALRPVGEDQNIWRSVPRAANDGLLRGPICEVAQFVKHHASRRQGDPGEDRPCRVPAWATKIIVETSGEGLAPLRGIADFPVIGKAGQLLTGRLGYDQETRLYIDSQEVSLDKHHFDGPREAYEWLRNAWLADFPFATEEDAARALTIPLTMLNRRTRITDGAPIVMVTAPMANTGKTLLVCALVEAITGVSLPAASWDDDPKERRKALMSIALENPAAVLFDNIPNGRQIIDTSVERWATSDTISDRLLGKNESATAPTTSLMIFTGNNISPGTPDLETRTFEIRLKKTGKRKAFKVKDLKKWTQKNRQKIIAAIMTIGNAEIPGDWEPTSRFPSWAKYVGEKVQFAANNRKLFDVWGDDSPPENEELDALLKEMAKRDVQNSKGYLAADMSEMFSLEIARVDPIWTREFMYDAHGTIIGSRKIPAISIPKILSRWADHAGFSHSLQVTKEDNPKRKGRKSFVFRAIAIEKDG